MEIITRLNFRELTAREYISYCKELLKNIKDIFPNMYLSILDDQDKVHFFQEDFEDFSEENLHKIIMEDKEIVYYNPDKENKRLTIDSTCWMPFSFLFFLNNDKNMNIYEESDISINISQGVKKFSSPSIINIEFSSEFSKKINIEIIKKLFQCLEKTNDLQYAIFISDDFWDSVRIKGLKRWIGYVTYFANKDILKLLENVDNIEISESNLGAMISLENLDFSEENIQKAIQIRNILAEKGLLSE